MSTKTTFKRIALVTVAALGFGLLSVAPSTATTQQDTLTLGSATTVWSAGSSTTLTNTITQTFLGTGGDTMSVAMTLSSAPVGNVQVPSLTVQEGPKLGASGVVGLTGWLSDSGSSTSYQLSRSTYTVSFTPSVPGTYVVTFNAFNMTSTTARSTVAAVAAAVTWTVTIPSGTFRCNFNSWLSCSYCYIWFDSSSCCSRR